MGSPYQGVKKGASFVIEKRRASNELVVGGRESLLKRSFAVQASYFEPVLPLTVRIRHLGRLHPCDVDLGHAEPPLLNVMLDEPIEAVAPGQTAVFYTEDEFGTRVVGAGEIL